MTLHPRVLACREELLEHVLERHLAGRCRPAIHGPVRRVTQRTRDSLPPLGILVAEVGGIAAEQLVGAFAGEDDLHVFACRLRQEKGWEYGGIAKRLGE